jgi:hypothetical protein
MKIRTGFVSNSSSSSFIVALPRGSNPLDKAWIAQNILGISLSNAEEAEFDDPRSWGDDVRMIPVMQIIDHVREEGGWKKVRRNAQVIGEIISHGYVKGQPDFDYETPEEEELTRIYQDNRRPQEEREAADYHRQELYQKRYKIYQKERLDHGVSLARDFLSRCPPGTTLWECTFSDNTSEGYMMEQEGLLDKFVNFRISFH